MMLMLVACDERFMSWKEYNEEWIIEQRDKLGVDTDVLEVEILPSGVLIEKYHTGYGAIPKPSIDPVLGVSSIVRVKYTGWLVDGTRFDSSELSSFYLSGVIEGWQEALAKMPQGSYTTYLFEKGLDKILKKVGEESTEVIIGGKAGDKAETIYEIADLAYHVMVLMVEMGISLEDVRKELASRHVIDHKVKQEKMTK